MDKKKAVRSKCWISVILAFVLIWFNLSVSQPQNTLEDKLFRLHILANSDSIEDQALKLAVRDEILPLVKERFDALNLAEFRGSTEAEKAADAARKWTGILSDAAQQAVYRHGSTQTAAVMVGYEHFPDRVYGDYSVPEGDYYCLRIVLGAGKGQNWWCVLYPPLCITPAAAEEYLDAAEMEILTGGKPYRFRFAIWDWICKWRTKR